MPLRILVGLLVGNTLWSAHPLMGKWILETFTPAETASLRYGSASLCYALIALGLWVGRETTWARRIGPPFLSLKSPAQDWLLIGLIALLNFFGGPLLQLTGLAKSSASDNALIVAMEPLFTVALAAIILRQRPKRFELVAFALALMGFGVLTGGQLLASGFANLSLLLGNVALLVSMSGESSFTVLGSRLIARRQPAVAVFGSSLLIGAVLMMVVFGWLGVFPIHDFWSRVTPKDWVGIVWLGPIGTTLSYIFWMVALTQASVASVALTLFLQPVLGAVWGHLFLDEPLGAAKIAGGALILAGLLYQTLRVQRSTLAT